VRKSRGRRELHQTAEINVTSLVDVAFTLLIIFIITAPMMQGGLTLDLPEGDVKPLTSLEDLFVVSVTKDDRLAFENKEITMADLKSSLAQMARAAGTKQLFIKADAQAHHGVVFEVMSTAMNAGLSVSILGEPKSAPPK
jgi:biopolymer transport protein ExbD